MMQPNPLKRDDAEMKVPSRALLPLRLCATFLVTARVRPLPCYAVVLAVPA